MAGTILQTATMVKRFVVYIQAVIGNCRTYISRLAYQYLYSIGIHIQSTIRMMYELKEVGAQASDIRDE